MTNITKTGDSDDSSIQSLDADNTLKGLSGNDTYTVDSFKDIVVEAANAGNDTLKLKNYNVGTAKAYTLAANVENLDLSEAEMLATLSPSQLAAYTGNKFLVNGNALSNKITAGDTNSNYVKIMAGAGDDTIIGGNNNDNIDGGLGSDKLLGNDGNDTLFGGADKVRDILQGGAGNDTYILKDTLDTIVDSSADSNTIKLDKTFTEKALNLSTTYASAGITTVDARDVRKALTLTGNTGINTTITGGSGADVIRGGSSKDVLIGGAGNDTFLIDGNENMQNNGAVIDGGAGLDTIKLVDVNGAFTGNTNISIANFGTVENIDASLIKTTGVTLTGNAANNKITGGAGNDTLNGGAGTNTLIGGAGDDTYVLNSSKDKVTELANSKTVNYGSDTIVLSSSYDLGKSKSYAILKNTENLDLRQLKMTAAQQASFLGKTKFLVNGTSSDNAIYSSDTNGQYMKILAGAGNDTIIGGSGDDYIDGGTGNDTIYGGDGNNMLIGGSGNDTYEFDGTESGETTIVDTSGIDSIKLLGDSNGAFLADPSTYLTDDYTTIENLDASAITATDLTLNGNNLDNTITGGSGNDTIFGGKGKNTLLGGAGDDTYLVDGKETSTSITDASGNDTVALQADENGKFAGGSAYSIAGFSGVEGLDASAITATNLTLTGNALDNTITGGLGINTLFGGAGNDTYMVSGAGESETIITDTSGTADLIKLVAAQDGSFAGGNEFSLGNYASVENLDASDITTDMTLSGNALDNSITGGAGNDSIFGGAGNDTIYGGAGKNVLDGGVGNDTYLLDGNEDSTSIVEAANGGTDTVKLVGTNGEFNGDTSIDMGDFVGVENLDASVIKSDLTITGNELDNTITGGSGSDSIDGGAGDDTIYGGATVGKTPLNSTSTYDSNEVLTSKTDYTYDNGNIAREDITNYYSDGTTISSKDYKTYDADGNKLSDGHTSYLGDGTTVTSQNDATYDPDGHQLTSIVFSGDGVTIYSRNIDIFTYDQNGNRTLSDNTYYGWNNSFQSHNSRAYTYDAYRNPTSEDDRSYDSSGNLTSHYSSEYTYYPDGTQKTQTYTYYNLDVDETVSGTSTCTYDSNGNQLSSDDKYFNQDADRTLSSWNKSETTFTVDSHGNPLVGTYTSSDSDGNSSTYKAAEYTYVYGANGKPESSTYTHLDSDGNQNSYKEFAYTYDANGKLTSQTKFDYSSDGTELNKSYTSTYDSQGKILAEHDISYDSYPTKGDEEICTFDAKGNTLTDESFSYDGGDFDGHSKTVYTYDSKGNKSTTTETNYYDETDDKISYLRKYTYDSKGTKIGDGSWRYNPDGTHQNTEIYTYYQDGQTQKSYEYNEYYPDGKLQDTNIKTYDSDGNSLTSDYKEYDTDGTTVTRQGTGISTYDGEGHQLSYTSESFTVGSDNSLTLQYREIVEYKYDSNGNKTSYTDTGYNSDGSVSYSNTTSYTNTYGDTPGSDTLFGGAGNNTLIGGGGNDTYLVDGSETSTKIIEADKEGNDTVQLRPTGDKFANFDDATVSIANDANVENLDGSLIKTTNLTLTGNDSYNVITGGDANDTLYGGLGNDTLSGGLGTNVLDGGAGNNTYLIDGTETATTIIDTDVAGTIKLVDTNETFAGGTSFSLAGYADVENLDASAIKADMTLQGNANVNGNTLTGGVGNDTYLIDGNEKSTTIVDASGNDTVKLVATAGTFAGNTTIDMSKFNGIENLDASAITDVNSGLNISGNDLDNTITGSAGNDTLRGSDSTRDLGTWNHNTVGNDSLVGGLGDDTYIIDGTESNLNISDDGGNDTIKLVADSNGNFVGSNNNIYLNNYSNIENIDTSGVTKGYMSLNGNDSGNKITAGDSTNNISTGIGNDTIKSGAGDDYINASNGDNIIDAGDGNNQIYTGAGDDTITAGDGDNYIDVSRGDNIVKTGNGNNTVYADFGNDSITTGTGNDTITAGSGNDTLTGGLGSDIYNFNDGDAKDLVTATNANDTININQFSNPTKEELLFYTDAGGNFYIDYTRGDFGSDVIEIANGYNSDTIVQLGGYSASIGSILASLDSAYKGIDPSTLSYTDKGIQSGTINWFDAAGDSTYLINGSETKAIAEVDGYGTDTLKLVANGSGAFAGTSALYPTPNTVSINSLSKFANTIENVDASAITTTDLYIKGTDRDNTIVGGSGNDTIDGGSGTNSLNGGAGNDTYIFDGSGNNSINDSSGSDTIKYVADANGRYNGTHTLNPGSICGGGGIDNLDASSLTGTDVTFKGSDGDNVLTGGGGNDTLCGSNGASSALGGTGHDTLIGGAGDDTYLVYGRENSLTINDTSGNDTVKLVSSYGGTYYGTPTISIADFAGVETLDASDIKGADLTLTGNALNNTIIGGQGHNVLDGGAGDDTYIINGSLDSNTITDSSGNDTIKFAADGNGQLAGLSNENISIANSGIENLSAFGVSYTNVTLTGNNGNNTLIGGGGNDLIIGGKGNDVLDGGSKVSMTGNNGYDTFYFSEGDGKDLINSTDEFDAIKIDTSSGITTADLLFYKDAAGNFFVDYTDGGVGTDVAEIAANNYDNNTTINIGGNIITIGSIIDKLGSAIVVDPTQITVGNKATQSTTLTSTWTNSGGDNVYLLNGTETTTINELVNGGNDTLKMVADVNGEFNPYNSLYKGTITIDNLSTNPNTIENVDASAITSGSLSVYGNDLDNTLIGGTGIDSIEGGRGNDTYVINSTSVTITEQYGAIEGNDTIKFAADTDGKFAGMDNYATVLGSNNIENIDASSITKTNLSLFGNSSNNTIIGGGGNDVISGSTPGNTSYSGTEHDVLIGGAGDDNYILDYTQGSVTINDTSGNDTITLDPRWGGYYLGQFYGSPTVSLTDYTGVENLDASNITYTGLTLNGNDSDNSITGGAADDTIMGGKGNDVLNGAQGANTFIFNEGDGKDTVNPTTANDTILIDNTSGISLNDVLFYTDASGNFFVDYSDGTVGGDIIELAAGYSPDTTIKVGSATISVSEIVSSLGSSLNLDPALVTVGDKTAQAAALASIWSDPSGDNIYLLNGTEAKLVDETYDSGNDTLKLVANGSNGFTGSSSLYPYGDTTIAIDNFSTNPDTIENIDASAIKTTYLRLYGNDLDNTIIGGEAGNYIGGGDGNNNVTALSGDNTINAYSGNDTITTGSGNDSIYAGGGNNIIDTGNGNNVVTVDNGNNSITSGSGDDNIHVGAGKNFISTGDGSDTVTVYIADSISAYNGTNIITGNGYKNITTSKGDDTITTGDGDDFIDAGSGNNIINAGDGNNVVCTSTGNNNVTVTDGSNQFYLGSGNDTITILGDGNNFIGNNDGNNVITTGNGDNKIYTGSGNDSITAGSGNDTIGAGGGNDIISGGAGFNQYELHQDDAKDIITSTNANDIINISDVSKADLLFYTDGSGNLFMDYTAGGISSDILDLGTSYNNGTTIQLGALSLDLGTIVASLDSAYKNVLDPSLLGTGDKTTQSASLTWADSSGDSTYLIDGSAKKKATEALGGGTDTLQLTTTDGSFAGSTHLSINDFSTTPGTLENLDASAITGTDLYIEANNLDNVITGGAGNDTIAGCDFNIDTNGWDTSMGGSGHDSLYGGLGDDTYLLDGTGHVTINDTGGNDTLKLVANSSGNYTSSWLSFNLNSYTGIENIDTSAVKNYSHLDISANSAGNHTITTGDSGDTISAAGGNYTINTGNGTDSIIASGGDMIVTTGDGYKIITTGAGNDNITTGSGNDYIDVGSGTNTINAGDGNNTIYSLGGNDSITTGSGNDTISSGAGNDTISGGTGSDSYNFIEGDGKDLLTSTNAGDKIDIAGWTGIDKTDMLFYTDTAGNFFIDYTDDGVGSDVIELAAGKYDGGTTVEFMYTSTKIYVNDIISHMSASTTGLDAGGIANLGTGTISSDQVATLANVWHT